MNVLHECDVTLESVRDEYRNIFESLYPNKTKDHPIGSVVLVATLQPMGKHFPTQFKKSCILCSKEGHKSVECYLRPENEHKNPGLNATEKALPTTATTSARNPNTCTYFQKNGCTQMLCFKKKNAEGKSNDQVAVLFIVTEHGIITKGHSHTFTNSTAIADSGATCHV
jgi:hypothetical protein